MYIFLEESFFFRPTLIYGGVSFKGTVAPFWVWLKVIGWFEHKYEKNLWMFVWILCACPVYCLNKHKYACCFEENVYEISICMPTHARKWAWRLLEALWAGPESYCYSLGNCWQCLTGSENVETHWKMLNRSEPTISLSAFSTVSPEVFFSSYVKRKSLRKNVTGTS